MYMYTTRMVFIWIGNISSIQVLQVSVPFQLCQLVVLGTECQGCHQLTQGCCCVVLQIRQVFPDLAGHYVGFQPPFSKAGDMTGNNFLHRGSLILG